MTADEYRTILETETRTRLDLQRAKADMYLDQLDTVGGDTEAHKRIHANPGIQQLEDAHAAALIDRMVATYERNLGVTLDENPPNSGNAPNTSDPIH